MTVAGHVMYPILWRSWIGVYGLINCVMCETILDQISGLPLSQPLIKKSFPTQRNVAQSNYIHGCVLTVQVRSTVQPQCKRWAPAYEHTHQPTPSASVRLDQS